MSETIARTHTKQEGRWYDPETGEPKHTVIAKGNGLPRPATLADARREGWVPSVTSILKILDRPALTDWRIEQSCLATLTAPRLPDEALDAFVHRVLHVERHQDQERDLAADRGKAIHQAMQDMAAGLPVQPDLLPFVEGPWAFLKMYGSPLETECVLVGDGYAGRTDLILAPGVSQGPADTIVDFKTTKKLPEKAAWPEHRLQLSAYAKAWNHQGPTKTMNVYISSIEPRKFVAFENPPWEKDFDEGFAPLLKVWQWMNSYRPITQP